MKKLLNKVRRKAPEAPSRITNETIAEHREKVLAGGRRFKYPVQYARHRLVASAIIIAVVAVLATGFAIYWQLYKTQNSGDLLYRITRVLPLPVASVDGQTVPYGDYLMKYRSSIHYLENKESVSFKTEDGKRQADQVKQEAMNDAIADAYATKLAKEKGITVSDAEIAAFLLQQRTLEDGEVSEATYNAVILDYYGWSPEEYRQATVNKLIRQKVSFAIDTEAEKTADDIKKAITAGATDFRAIATDNSTEAVSYGVSGLVPKTNQDGGRAIAAAALAQGAVSDVITPTSGEGYYIVRLIESNDTQVSYEYVHIPLRTFVSQLEALKKDGKVKYLIAVPVIEQPAAEVKE